jgi:hypothetical protein
MSTIPAVQIQVVTADALTFEADVLVLKHAQSLFGVDGAAYQRLIDVDSGLALPKVGKHQFVDTRGSIHAPLILFLGVAPLRDFAYAEIREFGRRAMSVLGTERHDTSHVAVTLHGPGYGLDEIESFESELAGVIEAVAAGDSPRALTRVTFVERDHRRSQRLSVALARLLPSGYLANTGRGSLSSLATSAQSALRSAGYASASKPRVFVAMPFALEMDDVFHYGIQGAVNASGHLAERADLSAFTGDVMEWVTSRISTADLVIADLSSSNPNVYLEVGYAWGRRIPTVLLARENGDLKFDVRGQRCILYSSIKELEEKLTRELNSLSASRA